MDEFGFKSLTDKISRLVVQSYGSKELTVERADLEDLLDVVDSLAQELSDSEDYEGQLYDVRTEIDELEGEMSNLETSLEEANETIKANEERIGSLLNQLGDCRDYIRGEGE